MTSKTAISILVALIIIAGIFVPVVSASTQEHIVIEKINSGATDGLDLEHYATTLDGYPGCTITSNSDGTVSVAYPDATKTVSGDAILIVGDSGTISSFIKSGSLCFRQADGTVLEGVKSVTLTAADGATVEASVIKSDDTSAVESIAGTGWYLPTLGGAYGSYTGGIAYDLSDVIAVGYFAGTYIVSKNSEVVSANPYNLAATIERDADGTITGVKYTKATAEAAAVDGSASAYTGEDPVILTPDDDDGTVAVLTPEEWDGEDAAVFTTPTGTLVGGLHYTTSGTSATVTGPADSSAESIIIPTTVVIDNTTYQVTSIGNNAFSGCTSLALISLPDQLTSIGYSAFSGCTSLALTSLPDQLTSIGNNAFFGCKSLALTSLPSGITSIKYSTFQGCTSLALTSLPDQLTSIGDNAFSGCTSLALTSLPSGITSIEYSAFSGCTSLALTSLPDQLTSIGYSAFYNCAIVGLVVASSPTIGANALPATLTEVLNLGTTTLTTAMGITDNTVVSDSIQSLAIIQQKQYINSYYEQKDGAVYDLVGMIPIIILAGLAIAIIGMCAARRD